MSDCPYCPLLHNGRDEPLPSYHYTFLYCNFAADNRYLDSERVDRKSRGISSLRTLPHDIDFQRAPINSHSYIPYPWMYDTYSLTALTLLLWFVEHRIPTRSFWRCHPLSPFPTSFQWNLWNLLLTILHLGSQGLAPTHSLILPPPTPYILLHVTSDY